MGLITRRQFIAGCVSVAALIGAYVADQANARIADAITRRARQA